ncbi:hypothetical protein OPV22_017648 [Ensete ventricosum]|uniref:V-type proton ATPase subunit n=1 Tax=Ensete ventricosum TaxID=4639 RepID=A0AAV8R2R0_ENSVE|nr:hypothetical protein OPV22_017648 [Ensete ventricosum]
MRCLVRLFRSCKSGRVLATTDDLCSMGFNFLSPEGKTITNEPSPWIQLLLWRNALLNWYGYMIDNVVLIVTGTLHERDVQELLEKCHPLGMFDRYPFCDDIDLVRAAMEMYPSYQSIFANISFGESQILDEAFYTEEVKRLCLAFEQSFTMWFSLLK